MLRIIPPYTAQIIWTITIIHSLIISLWQSIWGSPGWQMVKITKVTDQGLLTQYSPLWGNVLTSVKVWRPSWPSTLLYHFRLQYAILFTVLWCNYFGKCPMNDRLKNKQQWGDWLFILAFSWLSWKSFHVLHGLKIRWRTTQQWFRDFNDQKFSNWNFVPLNLFTFILLPQLESLYLVKLSLNGL